MKQFISKSKYIFILLTLTFFAVEPLLHPGFPPTHDGENHVVRFYSFDKAFKEGNIYPRWADELNNGYGIPLFNYVYPLPNYFGVVFHAMGMSFIDSFKASLLVATVIGVVFFYFWLRLFVSNVASLTGALFYAFAPYRFVDIYVRGSVGEVWALAWFPAFLWAITSFLQNKKISYMVMASIFLALTIFSHNILALMFTLFGTMYVLFLIIQSKNKKFFLLLTSCLLLLSIALSAIFWLPALVETKYARGLQIYDIDPNFPELYQLLIPSWGTGFSAGKLENQMSFQIGIANLLAIFFSVIVLIKNRRNKVKHKRLLLFFLGWFALVWFLMLAISKPIWHTVPLLEYFQFPWRFLSLMILICSFIAAICIDMISGKKRRLATSVIFIFLAIALTISYTKPAYYHQRNDEHYLTRHNFIHGTNSPGDVFNTIWMNGKLPLKSKRIEITEGPVPDGTGFSVKITKIESKTAQYRFEIESESSAKFVVNIAYFPGWELFVNGKRSELERTKEGLMTFSLPKGKYMVELVFNDTMIRKVGTVLSLMGVLVCLALFIVGRKFKGQGDRG